MHYYILRRLLLMLPTLAIISVLVFVVQEAAPGDYVTRQLAIQQTAGGMEYTEAEVQALQQRHGLDQPVVVRYFVWIGNFLTGDFGQSYQYHRPVSELIGERLLLSAALSYVTIMFTWAASIPIGVWTATHKYQLSDHVFTLLGFLGMSIPNFLLALVLMYGALRWLGTDLSGLFSPEYVDAPWSIGKVLDLLAHLWIPVLILGTAGTAGGIRTWRALMLDTMGEPFVKTARAKGLSEAGVVWKHAVPVAANPFLSGIGTLLTAMLSGEIIVSITMDLPTTGPLFYEALISQDTYLASAFLMFLSVLMLLGMLFSDIVLALVDPRIRYS